MKPKKQTVERAIRKWKAKANLLRDKYYQALFHGQEPQARAIYGEMIGALDAVIFLNKQKAAL